MASKFTLYNSAGNPVDITGDSITAGAVGEMSFFAGKTAPIGYLKCDGSEVSISAYQELYDYIGDNWGTATAGNFVLPNSNNSLLRSTGSTTVGTVSNTVASGTDLSAMTGLLCIKAYATVASTQGVDIQGLINEIQDMKTRVVILEGHH